MVITITEPEVDEAAEMEVAEEVTKDVATIGMIMLNLKEILAGRSLNLASRTWLKMMCVRYYFA